MVDARCSLTIASTMVEHYRVEVVEYRPSLPDLVLTLVSGTMEVPVHTTSAKLAEIAKYSWLLVGAAPWKATISFLDDHQFIAG